MSEKKDQSGQCLCGAVKFRITQRVGEASACHCDMCRRWCGGPFLALHGDYGVQFEGEENIVTFKSSDWAERGFCGTCGSNLFYRLISSGRTILCAGTLDDQSGLTFTEQVFIDEKPGFYSFAEQTETLTGAELFAKYAPPGESGE